MMPMYAVIVNYYEFYTQDDNTEVGEEKHSVLVTKAKDTFEAYQLVLDYYKDLHKELQPHGKIELRKIQMEELSSVVDSEVVEVFEV